MGEEMRMPSAVEAKVAIAYNSSRNQRHMILSAIFGAKANYGTTIRRSLVRSLDAVHRATKHLEDAKSALSMETEEEAENAKNAIDDIIFRMQRRELEYNAPPYIQYVNGVL